VIPVLCRAAAHLFPSKLWWKSPQNLCWNSSFSSNSAPFSWRG